MVKVFYPAFFRYEPAIMITMILVFIIFVLLLILFTKKVLKGNKK